MVLASTNGLGLNESLPDSYRSSIFWFSLSFDTDILVWRRASFTPWDEQVLLKRCHACLQWWEVGFSLPFLPPFFPSFLPYLSFLLSFLPVISFLHFLFFLIMLKGPWFYMYCLLCSNLWALPSFSHKTSQAHSRLPLLQIYHSQPLKEPWVFGVDIGFRA